MTTAVVLDAGPLGLISNPRATTENQRAEAWLEALLDQKVAVFLPEIADFKVRRELLRANKVKGIARLDELKSTLNYLPLSTAIMLQAAQFWAEARQQGFPTADDKALDGDVILAAQAASLNLQGYTTVVTTTNVKHLQRFVDAKAWPEIV